MIRRLWALLCRAVLLLALGVFSVNAATCPPTISARCSASEPAPWLNVLTRFNSSALRKM
jgi:hypothetical protein